MLNTLDLRLSLAGGLRILVVCAGVAALFLALPGPATAQLRLVEVGSFNAPVYLTAAPSDKSRIFVVERGGRVELIRNGGLQKDPFLTIPDVDSGGAGGLLSIAFPPNYSKSGRFYVFYTDVAGIKIAEYRRANLNRANESSRRVLLSLPHSPVRDHYGGQLQFAPSGNLYVSIGDGGPEGDPSGRAQDLSKLFGKILRINPTASGSSPYTVPGDNPYVGVPGARPEIWASGLRNPWRFSFDRQNGDMVIGDVGQDRADEIDFAPAPDHGRGANYGWNCFEGFEPYAGCSVTAHTRPLLEKVLPPRETSPDWCAYSLTGGYVARDSSLPFAGRYVYGDFCSGEIRSVSVQNPASDAAVGLNLPARQQLVSFGEDGCGRLYAVSIAGPIYRIQDGSNSTCP